MDFSDGEPENTIILYNGELFDYGFICWLAVTENEDRFFYTVDYENNIIEKRFPKGTINNLIQNIPLADSLEIDHIQDNISVTILRK